MYWVDELESVELEPELVEFAELVGMPEDGPMVVVLELEVEFAELLGIPEEGPMEPDGPMEPVVVEFAELVGMPEVGPPVAVDEMQLQAELRSA